VTFVFPGDARVAPEDVIELYAEDHLVGSAPLVASAREIRSLVPVADLPALPFPLVLRAQLRDAKAEVGPCVVSSLPALLRAMGKPSATVRLLGLAPQSVTFGLSIKPLGAYPRELNLLVDGRLVASARTSLAAGASTAPGQEVAFQASVPLREGMQVQLDCAATGHTLYCGALGAMELLGAALASASETREKLTALEKAHAAVCGRLEALANFSRERLLLERLDLYYLTLNERIDRALNALQPQREPPAKPAASQASAFRAELRPSELEGTGIFPVESDGAREWRWFGPNVTLLFKNVAPAAAAIALDFYTFGDGVNAPSIQAAVNALEVIPELLQHFEGGWTLSVPVPPGAYTPDGALILSLRFGHSHTAPHDTRLLSAVNTGAAIYAG
jgi:hypothetical protein